MVVLKHQLLLTFDVEDFISARSIDALSSILRLLDKWNMRGLFFITGHVAERLHSFREVVHSLQEHEIGFHSSAHSVRPAVFEYCDVEKYEDAYWASLERETSHINPLSGAVEGKGGIHAVKDLFPSKSIVAYRAPGYCCPPPHLEAMARLGIGYDFSWNIAAAPVSYREITFYPRSIFLDCEEAMLTGGLQVANWVRLMRSLFKEETTVLNFHPHRFVGKDYWDGIYHRGNPQELTETLPRDSRETWHMLSKFEALLRRVSRLEKLGMIETSSKLMRSMINLDAARLDIDRLVDDYSFWPKTIFGYGPKHIDAQLSQFFELNFGVDG
jgi:hypothetical protein